jgi:hypothetical protein
MAWLSGWSYRKEISVTGQSGAGTDFQVKFDIGDSAGGDFHLEGHCTNFPQDIEVTDDDGTTLLKFHIKDIAADPLRMWVKVADDLGSNQTIYVYYGKSGATTNSNGVNTFMKYDGWETGTGWYSNAPRGTTHPLQGTYGAELAATGVWVKSATMGPLSLGSAIVSVNAYPQTTTGRINSIAVVDSSDNSGAYCKLDGGKLYAQSNVTWTDTGETYIANSWHELEILQLDATTYKVRWDEGSWRGPYTNANAHTLSNIDELWCAGESSIGYFDDDYVRKYITTEPAFSSAGSEETPPTIGYSSYSYFRGGL